MIRQEGFTQHEDKHTTWSIATYAETSYYFDEPSGLSLEAGLELFLSAKIGVVSDRTVAWYRERLSPLVAHLGDIPVEAVTLSDLREWRRSMLGREAYRSGQSSRPPSGRKISTWTVDGHIRAVKAFFIWLYNEDYLSNNPAARLKRVKLPKSLKRGVRDETLAKLREACDHPRDRAILELLVATGARLGGLVGLCISDLDLDNRRVTVTEKGDKPRVVFVTKRCEVALRVWLTARPPTNHGHLFTSIRAPYRPLSGNGVHQMLKRLAERAGIQVSQDNPVNAHAFRHRLGRKLAKRGVNMGVISDILGHESVQVTDEFYGALSRGQLQEIYDEYMGDDEGDRETTPFTPTD